MPIEFPPWFKDAVFLLFLFMSSKILSELIKRWIPGQVTGGSSKHTLTIDNELIERFLNAYEKHAQVEQEMLVILKDQKQEIAEQKEELEKLVERVKRPNEMIKEMHDKLIFH